MTTGPAFDRVLRATHCPYARRSGWSFSAPADPAGTVEQCLQAALPLLRASLGRVTRGLEDGFVLELPDHLGETVPALRSTSLTALRWLSAHSVPPVTVDAADLERPEWWWSFDRHRLFVVAFGSCFGVDHTRHQFGVEGFFLVFQHELAFARRFPQGVPPAVRRSVRAAFERAGRPYRYDMGVVPARGSTSALAGGQGGTDG